LDKLLMVLSGKGGVGKTLVAINLSKKLSEKGIKVALVDGDLSNPNCAQLLGVKEQIKVSGESFIPLMVDGIEFFSMETISEGRPVSMQASEYAQILRDVLQHTRWTADVGIIDMPATITDTFLEVVTTFGEKLLGSVIVLQPAHINTCRQVLQLHKNEGVPVLGVIQNMSHFTCDCGKTYDIFGNVPLEDLCKEFEVEPLGSIPLSMEIRKGVVEGKPFLPDNLAEPIVKGVDKILEAKPVGVSFTEHLKERLKEIARDILFDIMAYVVEISNTEIDIGGIQKASGFPGGRTIELDITNEKLRKVKIQAFFRIEGGVLKIVKPKDPFKPIIPDDEIRIWERALIWSFLGRRTDTNMPWDPLNSWLTNKAKFVTFREDTAGTPRAVKFLCLVWSQLKDTPSFNKLKPILERIA